MGTTRLRHLVILLPGISGSVLQKDGKDVWAPSLQAGWRALATRGVALQQLQLEGADVDIDDLGDGIRATSLVPTATIIPGLIKIDGYTNLVRMIRDNFEVVETSVDGGAPGNLIQFPYDWRRDNRYTARRLKRVIDEHLPRWREHSGAGDAKVILIAHSMGGLVARHYLEVLDGWRDARALLTLGTPYRGSLNALNYLANGYKEISVDMSDAVRSFTSMYQLLPIYPVLMSNGVLLRVAEARGIPGIDPTRAMDALNFHTEISSSIERHQDDAIYQNPRSSCQVLPIVGIRQPTSQSAELRGASLTVAGKVPAGVDSLLEDGDGTVPRHSAIPIELSDDFRQSFFPERHGSLPSNGPVLAHVRACIEQMQITGLGAIRGFDVYPGAARQPAISLDLEDAYGADESATFVVRLINTSEGAGPPRAKIECADSGASSSYTFARSATGDWRLSVEGLQPGVKRISVEAPDPIASPPSPVHDLFEVVG